MKASASCTGSQCLRKTSHRDARLRSRRRHKRRLQRILVPQNDVKPPAKLFEKRDSKLAGEWGKIPTRGPKPTLGKNRKKYVDVYENLQTELKIGAIFGAGYGHYASSNVFTMLVSMSLLFYLPGFFCRNNTACIGWFLFAGII